jgi:hypothetical protein
MQLRLGQRLVEQGPDVFLGQAARSGEFRGQHVQRASGPVMDFLAEGRCRRRYLDWKDRFKENTERMRDGSLLCVAEVLKSLLSPQAEKRLSFCEKIRWIARGFADDSGVSDVKGLSRS